MKDKKFFRSQKAHQRLNAMHKKKSDGENVHFVRQNYHALVFMRQKQLGRILTKDEKNKAYDDVILTFF